MPFAEGQAAGARSVRRHDQQFHPNNFLTYRDKRLNGFAILRGLILFTRVARAVCKYGVAFSSLRQERYGGSGRRGALMGVVWNYAILVGMFVWQQEMKAR